jgi:hypothetical protein
LREDGPTVQLAHHQKYEAIKHRNRRETLVEIGRIYIVAVANGGIISTLRAGFITTDLRPVC